MRGASLCASLGAAMALLAVLCATWPATDARAQATPEPPDYQTEHYRSPTPDTLTGAVAVDDDAAYALWRTGRVLFVDVLPRPPKPPNLPKGTIWREQPREAIPGGIWLPDVGYGRLAAETEAYFRNNLEAATQGDHDAPVLFYCLADCWMSWNAAKRAREEFGYARVFWYSDGTDGWSFQGYPLERHEPQPR